MTSFELDVTAPVGDFTLKTPDGPITYDVMAITKEPLLLFERMGRLDSTDVKAQVPQVMEALASILVPQNGGPPAGELFQKLYDDGVLGVNHLKQMADFVLDTAVGDPPA